MDQFNTLCQLNAIFKLHKVLRGNLERAQGMNKKKKGHDWKRKDVSFKTGDQLIYIRSLCPCKEFDNNKEGPFKVDE